MNILINEQQYDNLTNTILYKKMFFKYWDKFGGVADDNFFKLFGFSKGRLDNISKNDVYRFLVEWMGPDRAYEKFKSLVDENPHKIIDCGGYNFDVELEVDEYDQSSQNVYMNVKVLPGGTVDLIMIDGGIKDIEDAINDENFGGEIQYEIQECVYDEIVDSITSKTGVTSVINKIIFP
jgi:hypothetical protein